MAQSKPTPARALPRRPMPRRSWAPRAIAPVRAARLGSGVEQIEPERDVDEVGRLDKGDDDEHQTLQLRSRLGLPRNAGDRGVARHAVADGGADRAAGERDARP